jgi:hypothetical protein
VVKTLLAVHVLAAIVSVGPVTVAASLFPRYARAAATDLAGNAPASASAAAMHRITRVYAVLSVVVPVFGVATASALHVLTQTWVLASMLLTLGAGLTLALAVVPRQRRVLALLAGDTPPPDGLRREWGRLAAATGVFNLAWAVVVVLMILRPGSTTGA